MQDTLWNIRGINNESTVLEAWTIIQEIIHILDHSLRSILKDMEI